MNDEPDMPMPMSGDGEVSENKADMEPRKDGKREKPLAIRGTLDDVLRAAMNVKPKDQQVRADQP